MSISGGTWTGGAAWIPEGALLGRGVPRGTVELHLDREGGWLRSDTFPFGVKADIRFAWREVEKVERIRVPPFMQGGVRFILTRTSARSTSRNFVFYTGKRQSLEIISWAGSNGVRVERKARFSISVVS